MHPENPAPVTAVSKIHAVKRERSVSPAPSAPLVFSASKLLKDSTMHDVKYHSLKTGLDIERRGQAMRALAEHLEEVLLVGRRGPKDSVDLLLFDNRSAAGALGLRLELGT